MNFLYKGVSKMPFFIGGKTVGMGGVKNRMGVKHFCIVGSTFEHFCVEGQN